MRESISRSGFKTHVGRGFTPRQAGREGPPYGFETDFRRVCALAGSLLTAAPSSALACPVCGLVGSSDNTWAYQAMSAMLTLLPLAMIGATVWWLARLVARADRERQSATQHVVDRDDGRLRSVS